jgi:hypothetical protein
MINELRNWKLVSVCYVNERHSRFYGCQFSCSRERVNFWLFRIHWFFKRSPGSITTFLERCRAEERCFKSIRKGA